MADDDRVAEEPNGRLLNFRVAFLANFLKKNSMEKKPIEARSSYIANGFCTN